MHWDAELSGEGVAMQGRRVFLLAAVGGVVTAGLVLPHEALGASVFDGNARLRQDASLDGSERTLREIVARLNGVAGVPLSADPDLAGFAFGAVGERRPVAELLEALALVTGGRWSMEGRGYTLVFQKGQAPLAPERIPDLERELGQVKEIGWPLLPAQGGLPPVRKEPFNVEAIQSGTDFDSRQSFGAALLAAARAGGISVVVQTPALAKQYRPGPGVKQVSAARVMHALRERTGGEWVRVGGTYALLRPREDLELQRQGWEERSQRCGGEMTLVFQRIGPEQMAILRRGEEVPFARLTPTQQQAFASGVRLHYSLAPLYDRRFLTETATWRLEGLTDRVAVRVGEHQIAERKWIDF